MGMSSSTSQTQGREERMITLTLNTDLEEFKHKEVTFYNIGPCFCVLEKRHTNACWSFRFLFVQNIKSKLFCVGLLLKKGFFFCPLCAFCTSERKLQTLLALCQLPEQRDLFLSVSLWSALFSSRLKDWISLADSTNRLFIQTVSLLSVTHSRSSDPSFLMKIHEVWAAKLESCSKNKKRRFHLKPTRLGRDVSFLPCPCRSRLR